MEFIPLESTAAIHDPYAYCSEQEALDRQSSFDIDPLESTELTKVERRELRVHDPLKIIKKFYRSAAGEDMQSKYPSRNNDKLYSCALYLHALWSSNKANACNTYGFIMDRIRAIRQELVIENGTLVTHKVVIILDTIIRFYIQSWEDIILSGIRDSGWFDEVLHERALSSCLASLISTNADTRYISYIIYLNISHVLRCELMAQYTANNKYYMQFSTLSLYEFIKYYQYLCAPMVVKATKCICHLQQGNLDLMVQSLQTESDIIIRSLYTFHILPYLRMWRFLLFRHSINLKAESTLMVIELAHRLYMTKSAMELLLSHCNITIDASTDSINTVDLKQAPVADLLNSFLFITSQGV